ncbi:response regulator [Laspinema sp. A4]|uniref:adenylate/guanylate cyclase domain-containing protein n=1 Tax=Laspinema sp. D2d TaxID=2953686 RepID=UPI0021BA8197|nr:adenylate/guanylate cyclase domain-containing protein [Laspinema sp. D2d]MCT7982311.1 response regulator [Laspinema sp. D2d]
MAEQGASAINPLNFSEKPEYSADILIVDDVPTNLRVLINLLRKNNYSVRGVTNGGLALKFVEIKKPDLILLDIMMPEMDGYEVCQILKENPQTQDIPIIFLSALTEGFDKAKAFKFGAIDYISKPFQVEEILARLETHLSQRALQKQLQEQTELLAHQNLQLQAEINERKLLEEKLRSAEEKMRAVFEAMTDIVTLVSISDGNISNLDILPSNWMRLYQPDSDIVGQTIEQLFDSDTAETWLNVIGQVLETRETLHFDYCLSDRGQEMWFSAAVSPVREDTVIVVARDISDRKQAEEALIIAEERYHSIVENAIAGIFQSTVDGQYLSVNPALAKIYGYASAEELQQSIKNINTQLYVNPDRRQEFIESIAAQNSLSGFESMVFCKDKSIIWISETARAVRDSTGNILYYEGIVSDITERKLAQEALKFQQNQTEALLLNILPQPIATRLQKGENPIADHFEEVSVIFADLVGFTEFAANMSPKKLLELLNKIFSQFDKLAKHHNLEKIKTIGDAYMVVGGLPVPCADAIFEVAQMALDMQRELAQLNQHTGQTFELRIGIHIGPAIAGVIGMSKFIYDLWGDTVNTASRMESSGLPGKIQVTEAVYERLKDRFEFEQRGLISVKGKGEMLTYWLVGNPS